MLSVANFFAKAELLVTQIKVAMCVQLISDHFTVEAL